MSMPGDRLIAIGAVGYGEKDRVRIAAARAVDPADLRLITVVVLHDVQDLGHGRTRGGGAVHQSVDNRSALGTLNSSERCLRARRGKRTDDEEQPQH